MKTLISTAALLLGLTIAAKAQTGDSARLHRKTLLKEMSKEAGISKLQRKQLKEINSNCKTQADAIKKDAVLTEGQKKEKLRVLHTERKEKSKKVFTPQQQEKIRAFYSKHPEMKQKHHKKQEKN